MSQAPEASSAPKASSLPEAVSLPETTSLPSGQTEVRKPRPSTWEEPEDDFNLGVVPRRNLIYVDKLGRCLFDDKYVHYSQRVQPVEQTKPKREAATKKQAQNTAKKHIAKEPTPKTAGLPQKGRTQVQHGLAVKNLRERTARGVLSTVGPTKSNKTGGTAPNNNETLPGKHCPHGCIIPVINAATFDRGTNTCLHGFQVHGVLPAPSLLPDNDCPMDDDSSTCPVGCKFSIRVPDLVDTGVDTPLAASSLHQTWHQCIHDFGVYLPNSKFRQVKCPYKCCLNTCSSGPAAEEPPLSGNVDTTGGNGGEYKACAHSFGTMQFSPESQEQPDTGRQINAPGITNGASVGLNVSSEDGFHTRPSIRLPIPDHVKGILVDDWENVTKNNQLVPLPHPHPVDQIVNDYLEYERPSRDPESPHVDILEETMAGLKEYFEKSLSRILLYRFERPQYHEIRKEWEKATENGPKSVCDTYGAEHLCRLIVSLPELVAQTTMDQQSVSRLREEISKFTVWLGKNAAKYFVSEYETPAQEYIDRARNI